MSFNNMAISRQLLREVLLDNQKDVMSYSVQKRDFDLDSFNLCISCPRLFWE
jgi:hypothetical protein